MNWKVLTGWLIGIGTGAGIVLAWQVGDWQYRLVQVWKKWK